MHFDSNLGLWGVKLNKKNDRNVREAAKSIFTSYHDHVYDFDQKILNKFIWPLAANDVVIY